MNSKHNKPAQKGDRVTLSSGCSDIGVGTVIDPDFNAYYALVTWDNQNFNSDITRLCSSKSPHSLASRHSNTAQVFGAAIPKSKLRIVSDSSRDQCVYSSRIPCVGPQSTFNQTQVLRTPHERIGTFNARNGLINYRASPNPSVDLNPEKTSAGAAFRCGKTELKTPQSDGRRETNETRRESISIGLNSKLTRGIERTESVGTRIDYRKERVSSKANSHFNPDNATSRGHKVKTNEECKDGHVMIREMFDTYDGDGVECDECFSKNIHLSANGFYHCSKCGAVDLCYSCAKKNSNTDSESTRSKSFSSEAPNKRRPHFRNKPRAQNKPRQSSSARELSLESGESSASECVASLPEFWFSLLDRGWIEQQRRETSQKTEEETHFDLVEKVNRAPGDALEHYSAFLRSGTLPNAFTFFILFNACVESVPKNKSLAHKLVLHMQTLGINPTSRTVKALLKVFEDQEDAVWKKRYEGQFSSVLE